MRKTATMLVLPTQASLLDEEADAALAAALSHPDRVKLPSRSSAPS